MALPFRDPFLERVVETEVLLRPHRQPPQRDPPSRAPAESGTAAFLPSRAPVFLPSRCPWNSIPGTCSRLWEPLSVPFLSCPLTLTHAGLLCRHLQTQPTDRGSSNPLNPAPTPQTPIICIFSISWVIPPDELASSSQAGNPNSYLSSTSFFPDPHIGDKPSCRPVRPRPLDLPPQGVFEFSPRPPC